MIEKISVPVAGQTPTKRRRTLFIAVFILVVLLAFWAAWDWRQPREQKDAAPGTSPALSMTVSDAPARLVEWPVQLDASGAISPWQEAIVGGQVEGGRLVQVQAEPGDAVRRGQVLARFDSEALGIDVRQLRAAYRQASAEAAQALANRDRALKLKDSGSMSEQEVLHALTLAETAAAQAEASHAQLASRELQLKHATVLSPDDGVVSARSATIGSVTAVGDELFRLIRHNRLEWRGELTASQLRQVASGQSIELALPDGTRADARVRTLASSLDPQTRLGIAYADLLPGSTARAGMYAQGRIEVAQRQALVVPASSVVIRDGRSHVFKLGMQHATPRAILQRVETGRRQGRDIEIVSGLGVDDRVLVQGAGFLNDGDSVRVVQAPEALTPEVSAAGSSSP